MGYLLKEDIATIINEKYKNSYFAKQLDLSGTYISLIVHRKQTVPKRIAYAFTKLINNEANIEDYFYKVK
jgi:hypothetical protein